MSVFVLGAINHIFFFPPERHVLGDKITMGEKWAKSNANDDYFISLEQIYLPLGDFLR